MKDHKISTNRHCPCIQGKCPIRGNCVLCVQNHLENKNHIPECFQDLIREKIDFLAKMVEFEVKDTRPDRNHWENVDTDAIIEKSLKRHL